MKSNIQKNTTNQHCLSTSDDPLFTEYQVENLSGEVLKAVTLRNWRSQGKYKKELPFVKIGSRIFYRKSVIEKFLNGKENPEDGKPQ